MHGFVRRFVGQHTAGRKFGSVVEVGSYDVNGTIRDLIEADSYTGVDRRPGPRVDLVANAHLLDHPPVLDLVVCCEVLEHDPDPAGLLCRMYSWLAPGGWLLVTCAIDPRAPHGSDGGAVGVEHYANVDPAIFAQWGRLEAMEFDNVAGDVGVLIVRDDAGD